MISNDQKVGMRKYEEIGIKIRRIVEEFMLRDETKTCLVAQF